MHALMDNLNVAANIACARRASIFNTPSDIRRRDLVSSSFRFIQADSD